MKIDFILNGKKVVVEAEPEERLLDILRYKLDCIGVKEACGEGKCGSCSIQFNGKLMLACLIPAVKIAGSEITTIEGLVDEGVPNYVQRAFIDADAVQCGFCTPGLVMSVYNYIEGGGKNSKADIAHALSGNLCRCTGYTKVIEAVGLAFRYKDENS